MFSFVGLTVFSFYIRVEKYIYIYISNQINIGRAIRIANAIRISTLSFYNAARATKIAFVFLFFFFHPEREREREIQTRNESRADFAFFPR